MTKKPYYFDTELYAATAKVLHIEQQDQYYAIQLDQTIFHPQAGGQPSDSGTIERMPVAKVMYNDNGDILHLVAQEHFDKNAISPNQEVKLAIDEQLRMKYAALHTAGHLIDMAISESEQYSDKISRPRGNHFPNQAKVTYEYGTTNEEAIKASKDDIKLYIENKLSQYISDNIPIKILVELDEEGRKIQVGNCQQVGCGGTHVKNTHHLKSFAIRNIKAKKGQLAIGYDCDYLV